MALRTSLVIVGGLFATCTAALEDIPSLGLGTWLSDRDKVPHAVEFGLQNGYDHIDAAWIYRNEDQTGKGIAAAALPRDDIWVTSKLWNSHHRQGEAESAIRETLDRLGLDQLDLYLVHWPVAFVPDSTKLDTTTTLLNTWRTLEGFVRANLTRHIGVSNFARADVEAILAACDICPYAHEFETHPYLQQQDFVDYHADVGVKVIAYSPFGNTNPIYDGRKNLDPLLKDPFWTDLAAKKNATPAQVVLAWGIQRGTIVIPKSTSEEHLAENVAARTITFTDEEMEAIAGQDKKARFSNPSKNWGVKLFADLDDHIDLEGVDEL
ncbi:Aldo/keto reductase [Cryphonectria parasitica EP155]|uniref:Aldo/keto reductase n=1 Tax=Cryphonectria parasitica (strain ATCC 38755 / EP155) TaxID=660469 RepID=A0A9P4XUG6_CRYP1|nr:Aldo/keto reductase [Cryphonectria parasitica EP155]KAF3760960.1 Aldo/keto reductase [Cryphonectria parasitica EP155]